MARKSISVERQEELASRYGVSQETIEKIKQGTGEERENLILEAMKTFANAIINLLVHPDDVEEVSSLTHRNFGMKKEDYEHLYRGKK